jgi:hypothetical protein
LSRRSGRILRRSSGLRRLRPLLTRRAAPGSLREGGLAKLKTYRLPVGFHDAYVAAPSQKAAIEAWGSDRDVFQRKEAELVTDAKLAEEPLANPGKVIKRLRGTAAEQIAALGETEKPPSHKGGKEAATSKPSKPRKVTPRPSRAKLDEAEAALAEVEARHEEQLKALKEREAALARERRALEKKQDQERDKLEARRVKAEAAYGEAMRRWRG